MGTIDLPPEVSQRYPFASRWVDLDGHRMHYLDEGQGSTAILLLHGNPTWSFHFRELVTGLRSRYRVIAPDHLGCGLSDKPADYPYTLDRHVSNLTRLLDGLSLTRVVVGIHDWGGAIGMGWAVEHVNKIHGLIIFNSAAFLGPCPWRLRFCRFPVIGDFLVRGLNLFVRGALRTVCHHRSRLTPPVRRGYFHPYGNWANRVGVMRFLEDIPLDPRQPSYRAMTRIERGLALLRDKPVMICWGDRDWCFHEWFLNRWRQIFPRAVVHRFDDAGHYVVEDAGDRIVPLIHTFVEGLDGSG